MTFASTIYDLRRELRLTQAGLAALLHVDKQSVSNWETGRNEPWPARQGDILRQLRGQKPFEVVVLPSTRIDAHVHRHSISARILEP